MMSEEEVAADVVETAGERQSEAEPDEGAELLHLQIRLTAEDLLHM